VSEALSRESAGPFARRCVEPTIRHSRSNYKDFKKKLSDLTFLSPKQKKKSDEYGALAKVHPEVFSSLLLTPQRLKGDKRMHFLSFYYFFGVISLTA
jgi:hypothetical protein